MSFLEKLKNKKIKISCVGITVVSSLLDRWITICIIRKSNTDQMAEMKII